MVGRIGHLVLELQRQGAEWQLRHSYAPERVLESTWTQATAESAPGKEDALPSRFLFREPAGHLELRPALADQPVIAKPRAEVTVPARNEAVVYVGTPLWVQLREEKHPDLLAEFCIERLSHTWFGKNTTSGEICYATATSARLRLENVPSLPDYAVTTLHLRNDSSKPLRFTHIKLPVATLAIYRNTAGLHITEAVTMVQTEAEMTRVTVEKAGPHTKLPLVGPARAPDTPSSLIRALDRLFD